MKIIGGSFGVSGSASITGEDVQIKGSITVRKSIKDIDRVIARAHQERKFGLVGFVLGSLFLGFIGLVLAGPIGVLIGIVLTIAGSFYSEKFGIADIEFKGGDKITLQGSVREINNLTGFNS